MTPKKYIKKVIVDNEEASAEYRAIRLRKIRNLANLSRKDLCNTDFLKLNTYKGWELARFGGLPLDGAERVVLRVAKENVFCSVEWLLYGTGQEPYILPQINDNKVLDETELILKEILVFQSLYKDTVYAKITDDALLPDYIEGDYVAGIKFFGQDMSLALNQVCLVELSNGQLMVRYLKQNQHNKKFQLLATNINNTLEIAQPSDIQLNFAAPVIRHYKKRSI
ncbi:MAG: hypothetical protein Q8M40_06690 [Legionella sp.]|nr:hypothetical protein [Legionella sp.]